SVELLCLPLTSRRQPGPTGFPYTTLFRSQDKRQVLGEIRKALKPHGLLGFNSTFFNGAYVEGTGGFWRRWVVRAVQVLREQGITVKHEGHAAAMQWLSAEEYAQACRDAGLRPTSVELVKVDMSAERDRKST